MNIWVDRALYQAAPQHALDDTQSLPDAAPADQQVGHQGRCCTIDTRSSPATADTGARWQPFAMYVGLPGRLKGYHMSRFDVQFGRNPLARRRRLPRAGKDHATPAAGRDQFTAMSFPYFRARPRQCRAWKTCSTPMSKLIARDHTATRHPAGTAGGHPVDHALHPCSEEDLRLRRPDSARLITIPGRGWSGARVLMRLIDIAEREASTPSWHGVLKHAADESS